jgi:hypothetical protein
LGQTNSEVYPKSIDHDVKADIGLIHRGLAEYTTFEHAMKRMVLRTVQQLLGLNLDRPEISAPEDVSNYGILGSKVFSQKKIDCEVK